MAGGLMQLVAYGAQDVYLTGNPQITFFKVVYRRHTNFSMETIEIAMNGNPDFGRRSTVTITRNGDLICEVYLMVTLPEITPSNGAKFAWIRRVGHGIIQEVEMEIGGSRIDKQYGIWFNIWYELARAAGDLERGFLKMIGDTPELTKYDSATKGEYILYIPMQFWFNRHVGLALPLIALQYHEVRLHFTFKRAAELIVANKTFRDFDMDQVRIRDAILLVNYVYLDSEERRRFAQVGHEYLIEQLQFTGAESVQNLNEKYKLDFNHPTKELIWAMKMGNYNTGKAFINYTHEEDWGKCGPCGILHESAVKILKESMQLLCAPVIEGNPYECECEDEAVEVCAGETPNGDGTWTAFAPMTAGTTDNKKISVINNSQCKTLWINENSLSVVSGCSTAYSITDKICADVEVTAEGDIICSNVCAPELTVRDLSIPIELMCDTRCERDDPMVYQCWNFGILIDGTGNPVDEALIQLNGHDRFDPRKGPYFNYVQTWQHHTNTPGDGINVYSFAINPEQHQPSGTANLSRIDNTQLNIRFRDSTQGPLDPCINFLNPDNKLYIWAINYNVLRIMSGMGGLAYSN